MDNLVLDQAAGDAWSLYNGDCVTFAQQLPDNSVDFSVYSPPFSSLYVYSESVADMGNVDSDEEFIEQYRYLVREKFRILRPGRLTAIHVKDLVFYQNASEDGSSGLRPFSDLCTQLHQEEGFNFHCRITIFLRAKCGWGQGGCGILLFATQFKIRGHGILCITTCRWRCSRFFLHLLFLFILHRIQSSHCLFRHPQFRHRL